MDEIEQQQLDSMHDEAMDLIEKSDGDLLWVEGPRGLLIIAADGSSEECVNMVAALKKVLHGTLQ